MKYIEARWIMEPEARKQWFKKPRKPDDSTLRFLERREKEALEEEQLALKLVQARPSYEGELESMSSRISHVEDLCSTLIQSLPQEAKDRFYLSKDWVPYTDEVRKVFDEIRAFHSKPKRTRK